MLKVKIKNFQSITDTSFEVDGFTVIVGKNNKGKSAVIRAIDAALSNKLGNNFIKWGKRETQVVLQQNNLDITWVKGDSASYKINDLKPFTSLKGAVPEPIINAGFKKLEINDEKLNPLVAHQFDEIFLLNKSGSFITETISTLYELADISGADILCQKKLKGIKSLLKTRESDVVLLNGKVDEFKDITLIKEQLEEIKKLNEKANQLKIEIAEIESLSEQLIRCVKIVKKLKDYSRIIIPDLNKIQQQITEFQWLEDAQIKFDTISNSVNNLKNITFLKIPDLDGIVKLINDFDWMETTFKVFHNTAKTVKNLSQTEKIKIPDLKSTEKKIQELNVLGEFTEKFIAQEFIVDKYIKISSDIINFDAITKEIKNVEVIIDAYTQLNAIWQEFISCAKETKVLQNDFIKAKEGQSLCEKELLEFKACPLCGSTLKHNNLPENHDCN